MGRVKIEIKKLNNSNGIQATYSKRKQGILKKANEISVLCDIDLVLLMFSPTGKASLCSGNKSIEEVIRKYAQFPAQERVKMKLEGIHALKKSYRNSDHDVDIPEFEDSSTPTTTKELNDEVVQLQNRLSEVQERIGYWTNPDSVNDLEVLNEIEDSVNESLQQIRMQKEKVANEHFMKVDSNNQLQNELEIPFHVNEERQLQDLSTWIPFDDMPHMAVPEEIKLPSQRDVGCFTGQSFTGPFGYINMCTKGNPLNSVNPSQENSFGANLSHQVPFAHDGQYPYPYSFNMMEDNRGFQHLLGMDLKTNTLENNFEGKWQPPSGQPRNDASSSHVLPMSCGGDSLFGEHLNSQKGTRMPLPMAPSLYKTLANDPSRMLYNLLNAPN